MGASAVFKDQPASPQPFPRPGRKENSFRLSSDEGRSQIDDCCANENHRSLFTTQRRTCNRSSKCSQCQHKRASCLSDIDPPGSTTDRGTNIQPIFANRDSIFSLFEMIQVNRTHVKDTSRIRNTKSLYPFFDFLGHIFPPPFSSFGIIMPNPPSQLRTTLASADILPFSIPRRQ